MICTDRKLTVYLNSLIDAIGFQQNQNMIPNLAILYRRSHWTSYVSRNGSNNIWESIGSFVPRFQKGNRFMTDCPFLTQNLPACKFLARRKEYVLQMLNNNFCIRTLNVGSVIFVFCFLQVPQRRYLCQGWRHDVLSRQQHAGRWWRRWVNRCRQQHQLPTSPPTE